jgi:hypothetical protein
MTFSRDLERILHSGGWRADRAIDLTSYDEEMRVLGNDVPDAVRHFLSSFGNLTFRFTVKGTRPPIRDQIVVDPAVPEQDTLSILRYCRKHIGESVYPVGLHDSQMSILLMDRDGRFYEFSDRYLWLIGNSMPEAFEAMITGARSVKRFDHHLWEGNDIFSDEYE